MNEDTNVQYNNVEGQPESELHTETKPAEDTSERTREQFEKLTEKNRAMAEKLEAFEARERKDSVLDSLKPQVQPVVSEPFSFGNLPSFEPNTMESLVDENGYVKVDALQKSIDSANERAKQAERETREIRDRFVTYEETQQTRLAHAEYPQLDPHGDNFDPNFFKLVRNELIGQRSVGKKDLLAAAAEVRKYYQPKVVENKTNVTTEDQTDQKQIINSGLKKSAPSESTYVDDLELVMATRKGTKGALAERLRRSGN